MIRERTSDINRLTIHSYDAMKVVKGLITDEGEKSHRFSVFVQGRVDAGWITMLDVWVHLCGRLS